MANYPTSVSALGTAVAGNTVEAAHVNDLRREIEAIEGALLSTGLAHHLLFVDATYDIGASGATRPRDLFLSRNATIGGTLTVSGAAPATPSANVLYSDSITKAWAYVTEAVGGPTLADDVNVSSITDSGVGDWTINYAANLPATYAISATVLSTGAGYFATHGTTAVGSIRILVWDAGGVAADAGISVICVG